MINEFYLRKALNIKKDYISVISDINNYENIAKNILKVVETKLSELNDLQSKINEKKLTSVEVAKDELLKIIIDLEEESNSVELLVNNLTKKMDKLKEEEVLLFNELKAEYPNLSNSDMKIQIDKFIDKNLKIKPIKED